MLITVHLPVLRAQRPGLPLSLPPDPAPRHLRADPLDVHLLHHPHHPLQLIRHDEGGVGLQLGHRGRLHSHLQVSVARWQSKESQGSNYAA